MPGSDARGESSLRCPSQLLLCWAILSAVALVLLALWQGLAYWEYSDGVYSLSARQLLNGQSLYRDFAAAQPPPLYYLGAGILAISDTPLSIRIAMALCQAFSSLFVLLAVRRLTRSHVAALCAAAICFVTPWALREHAQLVPEAPAAPLIMAAALAASSPRGSRAAGALCAAAAAFKLALVLPAIAVTLASRDVRRALSTFTLAGGLLGIGSWIAFGAPLWTNVVRAQAQTGSASLQYVAGLSAQAAWNLLPLLLLAGLAWPQRRSLADPDLARSLCAAAVGGLLLLTTLFKHGSYLTVLLVAEPPLLCLAASGVTMTLREWRSTRRGMRRSLVQLTASAAAIALGVAQTASLLASPANPRLFTRPFAATGPARVLSNAEVQHIAAQIRRCPSGATYPGPPYLAFVAGRDITGSQPDQFIIQNAAVHDSFRRAAVQDAACLDAPVPRSR